MQMWENTNQYKKYKKNFLITIPYYLT